MNTSRREAAEADQTNTTKPLLVRDLMTVGVPTCKPDSFVGEIARFLVEHEVEAMCVLDAEGQAIGVVGRDELVRVYGRENVQSLRAEDVMSEGVTELRAEMSLTVAAQIMRDKATRIAYVMHNAAGITYPAAYISYAHILRHLAARDENELKGLNPAAARKSPVETFIARRDEARRKAGGL
jgi:CBS domain-containing protein